MKVLAPVFLYPTWQEKIGQPDPLAPGYVGRYSPQASATGFDTHELCQRVAAQEKPHTWQLMNWRFAVKEFAISGSGHNQRIRDLRFPLFLKETCWATTVWSSKWRLRANTFWWTTPCPGCAPR